MIIRILAGWDGARHHSGDHDGRVRQIGAAIHAVDDRAPIECPDRIQQHEVDGSAGPWMISKLACCRPITRGSNLRTPESVDKALCSFQYVVTTSWIVRLRAEDRLLAVRSIYRCPPTHTVSPDYDAIAPVLFILCGHCRCPWRDLEAAIATRKSRGSASSGSLPPQTALRGRRLKCH